MSATALLYQATINKAATRMLIINAHADPLLLTLSKQCEQLDLHQHFKPEHTAIHHLGLHANASLAALETSYDSILLLSSKNKQQTLGWMAQAMQLLQQGGTLILACANKHGAKSYETALQQLTGNLLTRSKSKCRIFSAKKTSTLDHILCAQWFDAAQAKPIATHGLIAQPGLFSWNHADSGSSLLLEHLPDNLAGTGIDLCCGYGFLAEHLLRTSPDITTLHLLEADQLALDCAALNTAAWQHKTSMHWRDAAHDPLPNPLDWVVCNPPFHTGQTKDVTLGQSIIQRACQSLKKHGALYVVANRKLPYEALMKAELRQCHTLIEADGFKIIKGVR